MPAHKKSGGSRWASGSEVLAFVREIQACLNELENFTDLSELLRAALELAHRRLGVERCSIWLLEPDGKTLRGTWGIDSVGSITDEHGATLPLDQLEERLGGQELYATKGWIDLAQRELFEWIDGVETKIGLGWNTAIPIRSLGGQVGVFFQDAALTHRPLDPVEQDLLVSFCTHLGSVAARRTSEAKSRQSRGYKQGLIEAIDEMVNHCHDRSTLLRRSIELIRQKLNIDRCGLYLLDPKDKQTMCGVWGTSFEGWLVEESMHKFPLAAMEQELGTPLFQEAKWHVLRDVVARGLLDGVYTESQDRHGWNTVVPVFGKDGGVGAFFTDAAISRRPLDPDQQDMLVLFASFFGNALTKLESEQHRDRMSDGLREVLAAADELNRFTDLDELLRRGVELARERLGVTRSAIYLVAQEQPDSIRGTFGTDIHGNTTDERANFMRMDDQAEMPHVIFQRTGKRWDVREPWPMTYYDGDRIVDTGIKGWVSAHIIFSGDKILGFFYSDSGLSEDKLDPVRMEHISVYCSILGGFIEQRRMEAALRRAESDRFESLGQLAGGIAHDFNNLLAMIQGNLELAVQGLRDGLNQERRLGDALEVVERARVLSGQLLTFSRGGAPIKRRIDLTRFIPNLVHGKQSHALGLSMTLDIGGDLWDVDADPVQLAQVFQNLFSNLHQHCPEGVRVSLRMHNVTYEKFRHGLQPGQYIRIDLEDSGPGVPPPVRSRIFDPFFSTLDAGGIGLAACRSILQRHQGGIHYEGGAVLGGADFVLHLPAMERVSGMGDLSTFGGSSGSSGAGSTSPTSSMMGLGPGDAASRILVLDDEQVLRDVAREILEAYDRIAVTAKDGMEAVMLWRQATQEGRGFRVGILDLTIPGGMGGLDAARMILEEDPGARLVVCSGYANDPVLAEPEKFGFVARITKPFGIREFLHAVRLAERKDVPTD